MKQTETATSLAPASGAVRAFPRYPAYRDSGVPWLGQVPTHWEVKRLKYTVTMNADVLSETTSPDHAIQYLDIGNVDTDGRIGDIQQLLFADAPSRARRLVQDGDTIISTVRTYLRAIAYMDQPPDNLVVSTGFAVLRPRLDVDQRYLWRLVQSAVFVDAVVAHSEGVGYPAINPGKLANLPVWLPPLAEQRAISAFLDRETAHLDALVAAKRCLIGLLREKRAALISRAVTRGLDASAPLRDSGVPWLDAIPAHWDVIRTKFVARQATGHTPSRQHPEYWENCTIPWISLADVWQLRDGKREYIEDTSEYISELGLANSSAVLLPAGTVIVSRTASVGFSGIMARPMATTQDFANWVCGPQIRPEYLLYVFRSMNQEFRRLVMGSTHQTIYMPDIGRFMAPLPPRAEQDAIVDYVRYETAKLDGLMSAIERQIERLGEYRTALIAAAVTGQIDVREGAAHA